MDRINRLMSHETKERTVVSTLTRSASVLDELNSLIIDAREEVEEPAYVNPLPFDQTGNRVPVHVSCWAAQDLVELINQREQYESDEAFVVAIISRLSVLGLVVPVPERTSDDELSRYQTSPQQEPTSIQVRAMVQAIDEGLIANEKSRAFQLCDVQVYGIAMDMARIFGG